MFLRNFFTLCIAYFLYSIIGWCFESFIWAKCELKKFTNRGYLMGCYCPIYGCVALLDWAFLHYFKNPLVIFLVGALVCSLFEYLVSWSFEKWFHKRWWDYSNYPLNINGRVSVPSALFFGAGGLLLIKVVHPFVTGVLSMLSTGWLFGLTLLGTVMFCTDSYITTTSLKHKNDNVEKFYRKVMHYNTIPFDKLNEACVPLDKAAARKKEQLKNTSVRIKNYFNDRCSK